jgi:hypothetical protein
MLLVVQEPTVSCPLHMVTLSGGGLVTSAGTNQSSPRAGILGARLFRPFPTSASIGWRVRAGYDLPQNTKTRLESWRCSTVLKKERGVHSTRGRLVYNNAGGGKAMCVTSELHVD